MVICNVKRTVTNCSAIFVIIVASTDKNGSIDPSEEKCWKILETVASHLNKDGI